MVKPTFNFNDYVSLAVMLLMTTALIFGQAEASADRSYGANVVESVVIFDHEVKLEISGYLSEQVLKVGKDIVTDLGHFRGEDE